jgi:hypothetical protein
VGDSLADGLADEGGLDGAADAGELEAGGAGESEVALADAGLVTAAFCWGFAEVASFVALHPLITTATPTIHTGSKRTRTEHLTRSSGICLLI